MAWIGRSFILPECRLKQRCWRWMCIETDTPYISYSLTPHLFACHIFRTRGLWFWKWQAAVVRSKFETAAHDQHALAQKKGCNGGFAFLGCTEQFVLTACKISSRDLDFLLSEAYKRRYVIVKWLPQLELLRTSGADTVAQAFASVNPQILKSDFFWYKSQRVKTLWTDLKGLFSICKKRKLLRGMALRAALRRLSSKPARTFKHWEGLGWA